MMGARIGEGVGSTGRTKERGRSRRARRSMLAAIGLITVGLLTGCPPEKTEAVKQASSNAVAGKGRVKGAREAALAIAEGKLKIKEYPPLPSPPGHGEYIKMLRDRYKVDYEVPRLPAGVSEDDFIQEVRGWNETMEAEINRKFGVESLKRLADDAREAWKNGNPPPARE